MKLRTKVIRVYEETYEVDVSDNPSQQVFDTLITDLERCYKVTTMNKVASILIPSSVTNNSRCLLTRNDFWKV